MKIKVVKSEARAWKELMIIYGQNKELLAESRAQVPWDFNNWAETWLSEIDAIRKWHVPFWDEAWQVESDESGIM